MASSYKISKPRKSFSSKPELDKKLSFTDSSLFQLLNVINLDDICLKTFSINALLPDGTKREGIDSDIGVSECELFGIFCLVKLTVNRFSLVKDVIHDVCKEFKIDRPCVKLSSTHASIALVSNGALLENQEIIIEEARRESKDFKQVEDPRTVNLKSLVTSEEKYLECLKLAVDIYGESLRKSSLNHLDHGIIFGRLKPILEFTTTLLSKLKELLDNWNSSSCVASAFSEIPDILWVYDSYYSRLRGSKRLLRQKCKYDSDFLSMVNEIKTTAKNSLGLLILLPARRIPQYKQILTDILECTPNDHDDGKKLRVVLERIEQTLADRKEDINEVENEFRLIEIQDKFPHDDLGLDEEKGLSSQKFKGIFGRRRSAPATAIKAAFTKTSKSNLHSIDISLTINSEPTSPSPQNSSVLVNEGVVHLTAGVSSHDRYMFLFNDFLLIAKSKSSSSYKLKYRVKVSEMWVADCVDDVAESVKSPDKSFVFGWPTGNYVASFSTLEEKTKWYEAIRSHIGLQKELEEPKTTTIKIQFKENESLQTLTKTISVGHFHDANKVVQMALDHFNILGKEANEFQLWVLYKDSEYPLVGHEFPFAIQMNQHREVCVYGDSDVTTDPDSPTSPNMDTTGNTDGQLQFILKKSRKVHNKVVSNWRWIRKPMSWKMKKGTGHKLAQCDIIISSGKVFGLPLDQLTSDDEAVPKPINEFLIRLFRFGPSTSGVFRKTPNQREVKQLKEEIDEEKEICLEETTVHVIAGLMKEFLRKLPDAVLCSEYYEDFLATNDISDKSQRTQEITRLLEKLPSCNLELIKRFFCVLYHISQNSHHNNMTSFNLGVCVSPSMLWPLPSLRAETAEQAKSTAPQFVEFIIDHFPEIFGEDAVCVLGDRSEIIVDIPVVNYDGDSEMTEATSEDGRNGSTSSSLRHSDSSLYKGVIKEDISGQQGTLLTVNNNEITQSRSTPNSPEGYRKRLDTDISRKIHTAFYHPKHSPRPRRQNSNQSSTRDDVFLAQPTHDESLGTNQKPVQLSSITTSAELIEHVPEQNSTGSSPLMSRNGAEPAILKKTSVPKREMTLQFSSSQRFYTAPSQCAERTRSADRRRQPAAPTYQKHMQQQRNNNVPESETTTGTKTPTGNKSTKTKVGLPLSPTSAHIRDAMIADPHFLTRCSPACSSHVSPVTNEQPKRYTGSETSISSLSSNDECYDVDTTTSSYVKPDVTQLKHIRELLEVSGYANPLRISPETADMITRVEGDWGELGELVGEGSDMDDYDRMTMAEETYV